MKKLIYIVALVTLTLGSCSRVDFGDINRNPYEPQKGNIDALMRGAMSSFATNGGRVYYSNATLYAQYQSQTVYTQEQRYVQYVGSWYRYYVEQLANLKEVSNTMSDVRGSTDNMRAIAELTSVFITKRITDTYGDIPYFDALEGANLLTPNYTPQRAIYLDLIQRAQDARDMLNPAAFTPDADTDIFYGGDINKWGKFANSLIMALSIQLSNTDAAALAETAFNEALNNSYGVIEENSDNLVFTPDVAGGVVNPISRSRAGDFNVTKELTDALKGVAGTWGSGLFDPKNPTSNHTYDYRVEEYAEGGGDGLPYGYASYPGSATKINSRFDQQDSPFTLFSAAYTWLNRAEGALIYNTGEDAADMLTEGIERSYTSLGLDAADANAYAAVRIADAADASIAPGGMAQVIGEEKWFALFPDGFAAWAEQRRTGWPALQPAPDAVNGGVIPHRMLYPSNSKTVNPQGWAQGVQGLMPAEDLNTSKIWWEQ
jgi:hypothetical protein